VERSEIRGRRSRPALRFRLRARRTDPVRPRRGEAGLQPHATGVRGRVPLAAAASDRDSRRL